MNSSRSNHTPDAGILYLVPTPIGNLEDMTFRAIRIMKEADLIAAEDTRNTIKLLNHFDIDTKMISYHQHSEIKRQADIIAKLTAGLNIALVSDAGMPSISDPGYELVTAAIAENITVIPLPGANAALTALIASGLSPQPFYFYGFLPRQPKERKKALEKLAQREETWILYESPHRLKDTLTAIAKFVSTDRRLVLSRELTKRYEEFLRGTVKEAILWVEKTQVRGEFCLVIEGNANPTFETAHEWWHDLSVKEHVEKVMQIENASSKEAIKVVTKARSLPKREVYALYHEIKE